MKNSLALVPAGFEKQHEHSAMNMRTSLELCRKHSHPYFKYYDVYLAPMFHGSGEEVGRHVLEAVKK